MIYRGAVTGYLDRLAELLREAHGLPPDHVAATVADLAAYLAQAGGADPQDAFGPVDAFARRLAPSGTSAADEHLETWRWLADTYVDEHLMNRFGDEGWEAERVDPLGRFVTHRDPERPRRWEYRRELITGGGERLGERLARDGWEPCGSWVVYAWFKREKAVGAGPAPAPPEPPPVPRRPTFPGRRRGYVLMGGAMALVAAVVVAASTGTAFGVGLAVGLLVGAPVTAWAVRARRR
ncbi:hypothetical protein [Streptomyces sp. NBC_00118]|uniref:hypothetical protein n=1 Tax=unclassified Streptomyces TaxID=2593676 RepID=UPI003092C73B|nr:hypothetical protein OG518_13730 [Streptomyces sp. NBC_01397]